MIKEIRYYTEEEAHRYLAKAELEFKNTPYGIDDAIIIGFTKEYIKTEFGIEKFIIWIETDSPHREYLDVFIIYNRLNHVWFGDEVYFTKKLNTDGLL